MFAPVCSAFVDEHEKERFLNIERSAKVTSIARMLLITDQKNIDIFIRGLIYLQELESRINEIDSQIIIRIQPTIVKEKLEIEHKIEEVATEKIESVLKTIEEDIEIDDEESIIDEAVDLVSEVVEDVIEEVKEVVEDVVEPVTNIVEGVKEILSEELKPEETDVDIYDEPGEWVEKPPKEKKKRFDIKGFFNKNIPDEE